MANQKPIDEVRIGRVKATIWKNGTEDAPRYNVTFSRLYKDGDDKWQNTQELRAQRSSDACESGGSGSHSHLRAPPGAEPTRPGRLKSPSRIQNAAGITTPPFRSPAFSTVSGFPFFPRSALLRPDHCRQRTAVGSLRRPGPLRAGPGSRIYYEEKRGECGECRRWRSPRPVAGVWLFMEPPHFRRVRVTSQASPAPDRGQAPCLWHLSRGSALTGPCSQEPRCAVLSPGAGPLVSPHSWVKGKRIKPARREEMNQIQTLIDAAREALTSNGIHDTILAVGIAGDSHLDLLRHRQSASPF